MSRTYRKGRTWYYDVQGQLIPYDKWLLYPESEAWGWESVGVRERQRDGNPNDMTSPPKWFKRLKRHRERAQVKQAIYRGAEMPRFRTSDCWDWW